jgi:hypothetical protein
MCKKWLPVLMLLTAFSAAEAQTINAASCNASDVQSALNSVAADGTTVVIPSGTCLWSSGVVYNQTYSTVVQGQSTTTGTCAPGGSCSATDSTIIQDNINHNSGDPATFQAITAPGKSFRLTGITLQWASNNSSTSYNGLIRINGSSQAVRIDHNHFYQLSLIHIIPGGWLYGVIDHNLFEFGNASEMGVKPEDPGWNGVSESGPGDASWADSSHFGSNRFMFIENNTFQMAAGSTNHGFAFDCIAGGRFVFRYNVVGYHVATQTHGVSGSSSNGDNERPCRAHEEYGNTFTYDTSPNGSDTNTYFSFLEDNEAGSGLFWNNTVTGFQTIEREDTVRTNNITYPQVPTPNGWGYCGSPLGPSTWDGNTNSTGYPCLDQVGRGQGDMLTGAFPNKLDSVTGTITWPNEAPDPWYVWNITYNTFSNITMNGWWTNLDSAAVENRDYYLELPNYTESGTFSGTAGIGVGLYSGIPSKCTPLVAYWATDQNTLYQCSAPNTWTAYYTPYTYPHPLTQGGSTGPAAPTALTATVN